MTRTSTNKRLFQPIEKIWLKSIQWFKNDDGRKIGQTAGGLDDEGSQNHKKKKHIEPLNRFVLLTEIYFNGKDMLFEISRVGHAR